MKKISSQSGFSLVETLVAVTILLIVIVGPMKISSQAAKSSSFSSEQVTAFFLAQEGIELMEKARDDLLLPKFVAGNTSTPWGNFTDDTTSGQYQFCYKATGCGMEIKQHAKGELETAKDCSVSATECLLYFDSSGKRASFTHKSGGNVATIYTRVIKMEKVNADEVKVTSTVTWRNGALKNGQTVSVETRLFNVYGTS